jgi:UDP-N-acetylmuramoyl-L-alanyl-D-glutamate--2,6-diaminopimelate ligase
MSRELTRFVSFSPAPARSEALANVKPRVLVLGDLLRDLAARGFVCRSSLPSATPISGAQLDSRKIRRGDLFIALPGHRADGLEYARDAVRAGAIAVVCAQGRSDATGELPTVFVGDAAGGLAAITGHIAAILAGDPSRDVALVGVTGTNGKTSCTYLLESVWNAAGIPCGVGGTISQRGPGFARTAHLTTPDAIELQAFLSELRDAGARWAALEVSSHALSQHRIEGCEFRAAIFTNLTRDHLDYHGDEDSYFAAKLKLFTRHLVPRTGVAILNADDPREEAIRRARGAEPVVTYSGSGDPCADVRVFAESAPGVAARGRVVGLGQEISFSSRLFGEANVANIAAVAAAALATGVDPGAIGEGISRCAPVPGRLERVGDGEPAVFVDYAHTPDALERTLAAARHMSRGRLIVVFGCGGDRDRGKRPMMGAIAGGRADVAILTSDNPRSEDPLAILAAIEEGMAGLMHRAQAVELARGDVRGYLVEPDRERAIRIALSVAHSSDLVVIAGKGHEDYQEIAGVRRPFDDRTTAARVLREM